MENFIELYNTYAPTVISILFILAQSSISFGILRQSKVKNLLSSVSLNTSSIKKEATDIMNESVNLRNDLLEAMNTISQLTQVVSEVKSLPLDDILKKMTELEALKNTIEFKDTMIASYQKDIKAIKVELEKIKQRGE